MDDLQYSINKEVIDVKKEVLNLVINGWPSIHIEFRKDVINKMIKF